MSLVALVRGRQGSNGFGYASTAQEVTAGIDLGGKNVLITGINSGLGAETGRVLHLRGARILGAARTEDKARAACERFGDDAVPLACELSDPASIRACVAKVKTLDISPDAIVCNAGIMNLPERELVHGQEKQFFTNHVGHFMLVTGLLDALAEDGRVVMLSSAAHMWAPKVGIRFDDLSFDDGYSPRKAYGHSKLANLLFARALATRFEGTARTANAVHPGVIHTNLTRYMNPVIRALEPIGAAIAMKSIPQGAATQCYVAAHPDAAEINGEYWVDVNVARSSRAGRDMQMAQRLWEVTEEIVAGLD
jgi:WW domain-containing oxidoreductase